VRIVTADLVMSLDNVAAAAGVSHSDPIQLTVGLTCSIAVILACSNLILVVMNRYRCVAYVGAGDLALTAAGMMRHDLESGNLLWSAWEIRVHFPLWADWILRGVIMGACLSSGLWWPKRLREVEPIGTGQ